MKIHSMKAGTNITISNETHKRIVIVTQMMDGKVGRWADRVLQKELEKAEKKLKIGFKTAPKSCE